ncbi:hypothetical protein DXB08_23830 [Hungatella hathewayi]|uniref:hypothetical protein n=1 Tax=Hungatella hathewayi TaxID=154046 RepID=UPI000E44F7D2|nr:hypothetical protein [Hungatella hathewayi]RGO68112.1 hypothetical protein DXB08_23830 [Hungatella hathewayi]
MKFINDNQKSRIKIGGRKAVRISKGELTLKILEAHSKCKYSSPISRLDEVRFFKGLSPQIEKDLSVIVFDEENFTISHEEMFGDYDEDALMGIHTLENGLTFLGCQAGGDWECPIFYIIYWDGKQLRGYIPIYGNSYNSDFMTAFGSEGDNERIRRNINRSWSIIQSYIDLGLASKFEYYPTFEPPFSSTSELSPLSIGDSDVVNWTELFFLKYGLDLDTDMNPNWDAIKENILLGIAVI